jgi:hypothetical protein
MTKKDALEKTREGLLKILKESLPLCDHIESNISSSFININKTAYELKILMDRFENLEN